MLETYSDFLAAVDTMGIMAFAGNFLEGFPKLDNLTSPHQWHTGEAETDPWKWKDRAAEEKHMAFGNILGGHKGFISKSLYSLFYSACRPDGIIEDRYRSGSISKSVYDVYKLFSSNTALDTAEIRKRMGVTKKEGSSIVDGAVVKLQSEFYITVCGNRRKISFNGKAYGWPANTYCLVDDWAENWLMEPLVSTADARAQILWHCATLDSTIDIKKAEKLLFKN